MKSNRRPKLFRLTPRLDRNKSNLINSPQHRDENNKITKQKSEKGNAWGQVPAGTFKSNAKKSVVFLGVIHMLTVTVGANRKLPNTRNNNNNNNCKFLFTICSILCGWICLSMKCFQLLNCSQKKKKIIRTKKNTKWIHNEFPK